MAPGTPPAAPPAGGGLGVEPTWGGFEVNTLRPGGDYSSFDLVEARPELCRDECTNDSRCLAFTYVKPGPQAPQAHCWLKNFAPGRMEDPCCVSAAKIVAAGWQPPPPPLGAFDLNMTYVSGDYRDFELEARPELCRDSCLAEERCVAFTYVKPGPGARKAHCWLKNWRSSLLANDCCISGSK